MNTFTHTHAPFPPRKCIHFCMHLLVGWCIPKEQYHHPILPVTLSCHISHSTRKMMTPGTAIPSSHLQEATSYVCLFMLMAIMMVKARTYQYLYVSWRARMMISCSGLLNTMWRMGYSTGKEMRIMSSTPLHSRMPQHKVNQESYQVKWLLQDVVNHNFSLMLYYIITKMNMSSIFMRTVCVCEY